MQVLLEDMVNAISLGRKGCATLLALKRLLLLAAAVRPHVNAEGPVMLQVLTTQLAHSVWGAEGIHHLCSIAGDIFYVLLYILPGHFEVLLSQVPLTIGFHREWVVADFTDVRPLPAVCPQVPDQRCLVSCDVVTDVALVWGNTQVRTDMSSQDTREGKHLVTETAGVQNFPHGWGFLVRCPCDDGFEVSFCDLLLDLGFHTQRQESFDDAILLQLRLHLVLS